MPPGRVTLDRKGPVLVLSRHRVRSARLLDLLESDRFEVLVTAVPAEADAIVAARSPTVIVIDWGSDDEPPRQELVHRLRPRRSGARLVVVADGLEAEALAASLAVQCVISTRLGPEEVTDAAWRAHHETIDARRGR